MKPNELTTELLALRAADEPLMVRRLAKCLGRAAVSDDPAEKGECDFIRNAGAVRIIEVRGLLARGVSGWWPWATDFDDLEKALLDADDDETVSAIVLDVDSPGGTVNGTPEAADVLASIQKPVVAYTAGGMYSAAYYLAAAADMILARRSAGVGSIGVIAAHVDYSAFYEREGIGIDVFRSGENKAPGAFGLSLSHSQREMIQGMIDAMGDTFRAHVMTYRNEVDDGDMDGREFTGEQAVSRGLADATANNIKDAIRAALSLAGM